ncbi:MAG: TRAP transporter substrate-binding protein [Hyphomicrobiales bacterium]|nr:TRAP transporter substrate-binding protein [Nitratireductor sp.]MCC2098811.1 TRAP transporter substrate-binding protein [Hyphomicrobiales bacterium]
MNKLAKTLSLMALTALGANTAHATETLNVVGIFSSQKNYQVVEEEFFKTLPEQSGLDLTVNYTPVDQLGVKARDLLRLVGSGAFDVMIVGVPIVAGDHPLLEGLDIAGIAPTGDKVEAMIADFKPVVDDLLQAQFNTKVGALWHFAPMQLFCKEPINTKEELAGKKVRTFTRSQALLMSELGMVTVDLNFAEVYTALQRGVVDCAVTDSTGANGSKIVEVAHYQMNTGVSQMVAGYFINLDKWNSFSEDDRVVLQAQFDRLEAIMRDRSKELATDASNCNIGVQPCKLHDLASLTRVEPTPEFLDAVREAAQKSSLPTWAKECNAKMPECTAVWNKLVGARYGLTAE